MLASTAFDADVVEVRPGYLLMEVTGKGADSLFASEPGGHRWQRVPPNEKRGRVHTSTVTVAVLETPADAGAIRLDQRDVEWTATRGSGPGGQHRNKTDSAVQVRHRPTGMTVRCEGERSQRRNLDTAMALLAARLAEGERVRIAEAQNAARRAQVGSGMRGDKVRTIRLQDDVVTDHRSGRRISAAAFLSGRLEGLAASTVRR